MAEFIKTFEVDRVDPQKFLAEVEAELEAERNSQPKVTAQPKR
jgi:hypothetical protein